MKEMSELIRKYLFTASFCLLAGLTGWAQPADPDLQNSKSVIILFRHGETEPPPYSENPPNPVLSEIGKERAQLLAALLKDVNATQIYSTNLNRTKQTADPIREMLNLEFTFYEVKTMPEIANNMKANPGVYLVSGHSNTTPEMVRLLGGEPGEPINENEYDRLYIITIAGGNVSSLMLRYGRPYVKN